MAVEDARGRGREVPSPGRRRHGVLSFSLGRSRERGGDAGAAAGVCPWGLGEGMGVCAGQPDLVWGRRKGPPVP